MIGRTNRLLLIFVMSLAGHAVMLSTAWAQHSAYAFEHVNVVPMDHERILEGYTVVVSGDRITEVGPAASVSIPDGAVRIDGRDKYLMPGLAEMHGHIPSPIESPEYTETVLFLFVANGVTTVRGMQGRPGQLDLKARVNAGEILGPTLYLAGPGFGGGSVDSPAEADAMVRRQKAEGWDLLKVLTRLSVEEYDAMARAANEVGIHFGGHVPDEVGLLHAVDMGQLTFDHIDGYITYLHGQSEPVPDAAIADAVQMTLDAGVWVVPTMVVWETVLGATDLDWAVNLPELKYMPPFIINDWIQSLRRRKQPPRFNSGSARNHIENRMRLLRALNEGGANILMGTDAPQMFSVPGFSIHHELQRMVEAGMTPYEIYRTGSVMVGRYMAEEDKFGMIAEGQRADLLFVDANPLDDVANIKQRSGVMVRGRWVSEQVIRRRLEEIAGRYASLE